MPSRTIVLPVTRRSFFAAVAGCTSLRASPEPGSIHVGCQANAWPLKEGDFDQLLNVLATMKHLGYAGFECNVRYVRDQFDHLSDARRRLKATGVQFVGAHMSANLAGEESFAALAKNVAELGASFIVMSDTGLCAVGHFSPEALLEKAAKLNRVGKVCQGSGIRLAYHNHTAEFANANAEMNGLADKTDPNLVHFLMDAGHGYQGGGDPAAFMLRNATRVVGCHLKTFRQKTKQQPLGQGDFGFEALAAAVKRTGWTGWLIDEEGGGKSGGNSSAVGPDREYIRRIFGA